MRGPVFAVLLTAVCFVRGNGQLAIKAEPQTVAAQSSTGTGSALDTQNAENTDRLYHLALELKAELEKSGKDTLSVAALKKAAEIERLARTLRKTLKTP